MNEKTKENAENTTRGASRPLSSWKIVYTGLVCTFWIVETLRARLIIVVEAARTERRRDLFVVETAGARGRDHGRRVDDTARPGAFPELTSGIFWGTPDGIQWHGKRFRSDVAGRARCKSIIRRHFYDTGVRSPVLRFVRPGPAACTTIR